MKKKGITSGEWASHISIFFPTMGMAITKKHLYVGNILVSSYEYINTNLRYFKIEIWDITVCWRHHWWSGLALTFKVKGSKFTNKGGPDNLKLHKIEKLQGSKLVKNVKGVMDSKPHKMLTLLMIQHRLSMIFFYLYAVFQSTEHNICETP